MVVGAVATQNSILIEGQDATVNLRVRNKLYPQDTRLAVFTYKLFRRVDAPARDPNA